jgi:hypothetical protein
MRGGPVFSERVTRVQVAALEAAEYRAARSYSIPEVAEFSDRMSDIWLPDGTATRDYTADELAYVENELLMTKASFAYFAERYLKIVVKEGGVRSMYPLLDSQKFIVRRMGKLEEGIHDGTREDGILIALLKGARQIGGTTLAEAIIAHRIATQDHLNATIASDKPEDAGSAYLYTMLERMLEELPRWLRPAITDRQKNRELKTDGGSHVRVGAGKSTRGTTGQRGQIGRGMTIHLAHLSEISTWDNADQIQDALMPTIPFSPRVFVMLESTAKGRHNTWHRIWDQAKLGDSRFSPVYIGWYAEPSYTMTPPVGWAPSPTTLAAARRAEELGPRWTGSPVKLTQGQLYWYEWTRKSFEGMGRLKAFIEEFGAIDDTECFQHSGSSIFSTPLQQAIKDGAKPMAALLDILPRREIMDRLREESATILPQAPMSIEQEAARFEGQQGDEEMPL